MRSIAPDEARIAIDGEGFDAAILAVAPHHLAALWPEAPVPDAYEPIATVYLQFSAKTMLPFPLYNLLGGIGQWVVDRRDGLLACVLSGHGEWETLDDEALTAALNDELHAAGLVDGRSDWQKVIHEKRATFTCRPNLPRAACHSHHSRLYLAGDHTWADYPATLEGAVRSGLRAAQHVLQDEA